MRRLLVVPIFLLSAATLGASCQAQTSPEFQTCSKIAKTQLALDTCASGELALRNRQMQAVYAKVLSRAAGQAATLAKVRAMQSAWLAYAGAYLEALYPAPNKQMEYGSVYPMEAALARSALVQRHIVDLQALLARLQRP